MLIALKDVTIRYNSKEFFLKEGDKFDVRDFDVPNAGVVNTEKHIMKKNPGCLDLISGVSESKETKATLKKVTELEGTIKELNQKLVDLQSANDALAQKHSAAAGEVAAAQKDAKSSAKNEERLIKVNAELEEEIKALRLRVGTSGKTK